LKSETKLSKITVRSGTRQSPTLVNNLTKIGSTLSLEEHQLHAWGRSACREAQNIRDSRSPSIKNLQDSQVNFGGAVDWGPGNAESCRERIRTGCQSADRPNSSRGEPIGFGDSSKRIASKSSPQMNIDFQRKSAGFGEPRFCQLSVFQRPLDYISDIERGRTISIRLLHHAVSHSANFFRGLLRSNIIFPDVKNHVLNKLEGVIQH
jgi:hypothetical protein